MTAQFLLLYKGGILRSFFIYLHRKESPMITVNKLNEIEIEDDVERLIILRKRLNLSQYQFAQAVGVSSSYIGQVERGKIHITNKFRARINDFLKREKEMYEKDIFSNF
jgi:predicted transcriptional regulator